MALVVILSLGLVGKRLGDLGGARRSAVQTADQLDELQVEAAARLESGVNPGVVVRIAPRGDSIYSILACLDLESGRVRWLLEDEAGFGPPLVADLNGDGDSEVLVSTRAGARGEVEARLLTSGGEELWARRLHGPPVAWASRVSPEGGGWDLLLGDAGERVSWEELAETAGAW